MTIYEGITLFILLIGMVVIVMSFFVTNREIIEDNQVDLEDYEEYQARIEEINQKILELNEYSEFMKAELEEKHKELLFLYQLVNEKDKELKKRHVEVLPDQNRPVTGNSSEVLMPNQVVQQSAMNHNRRIIELSEKGYSIAEIGKLLEIGQGQVKLVLDLYK